MTTTNTRIPDWFQSETLGMFQNSFGSFGFFCEQNEGAYRSIVSKENFTSHLTTFCSTPQKWLKTFTI